METPRVSVIIPAFNEAPRLFDGLSTIHDHLSRSAFTWEIVVVDDGSADDTSAEALRFADDNPEVTVVAHPNNLGLGQALKTGFRAARGDILIAYDADLSYDPEHLDRLVSTMETTGAAVVAASPYMEGGTVTGVPAIRALMSRWANWILRRLSLHHIATVTGMVRAYEKSFIDGLSLKSMDNQINAEIIYKATLLRKTIIEIPGHLVWTRDETETKRRRVSMRYFTMILDSLFSGFIFRPFTFFLLPGMILLFLSMYALGWAAWHFFSYLPEQSGGFDSVVSGAAAEVFAHSPHSIVIGGIALVVAIQLLSIGIISAQNKRYFEEVWYQGNWMTERLLEHRDVDPTTTGSQARELTL